MRKTTIALLLVGALCVLATLEVAEAHKGGKRGGSSEEVDRVCDGKKGKHEEKGKGKGKKEEDEEIPKKKDKEELKGKDRKKDKKEERKGDKKTTVKTTTKKPIKTTKKVKTTVAWLSSSTQQDAKTTQATSTDAVTESSTKTFTTPEPTTTTTEPITTTEPTTTPEPTTTTSTTVPTTNARSADPIPALESNLNNKIKPAEDRFGSGSGSIFGSGSSFGSSSKGGSKKKEDDWKGGRAKSRDEEDLFDGLFSFGNGKPLFGSKGKGNGNKADEYLPSTSKGYNGGQKEVDSGSMGKTNNKKPYF